MLHILGEKMCEQLTIRLAQLRECHTGGNEERYSASKRKSGWAVSVC